MDWPISHRTEQLQSAAGQDLLLALSPECQAYLGWSPAAPGEIDHDRVERSLEEMVNFLMDITKLRLSQKS